MQTHRFRDYFESYPLPRPSAPAVTTGTFIVCPPALVQGLPFAQQCWAWAVYQLAFEQARAATQPSLVERDLLGVWN